MLNRKRKTNIKIHLKIYSKCHPRIPPAPHLGEGSPESQTKHERFLELLQILWKIIKKDTHNVASPQSAACLAEGWSAVVMPF